MSLTLIVIVAIVGLSDVSADINGDGLDEIGVFAIESRGEARGPWFQLYDGTGAMVGEFFLEEDLTDFQIECFDIDADGIDEAVILGVNALGIPVLQARNGTGLSLGRQFAAEPGATNLKIFPINADGAPPVEIGIGYTRPLPVPEGEGEGVGRSADAVAPQGSGLVQIWGAAAPELGGLFPVAAAEVIPSGHSDHEWLVGDVDGDGAEEVIAGYSTPPVFDAAATASQPEQEAGDGAMVRVWRARGATAEWTAADSTFTDAQWVLGDFIASRPGVEILVGLRWKIGSVGTFRIFDGDGGQIRAVGATPTGASELHWGALWRGEAAPAEGETAPPVVPTQPKRHQPFLGYLDPLGGWTYQVWEADTEEPFVIGGGTVLGTDYSVGEWFVGNFDGNVVTGDSLVMVFTHEGERSYSFLHWSRVGLTNLGAGTIFDSTHIEHRALVIRAVAPGRDDLLVSARPVEGSPKMALWDVNGTGTVLLSQDIFNSDVQ